MLINQVLLAIQASWISFLFDKIIDTNLTQRLGNFCVKFLKEECLLVNNEWSMPNMHQKVEQMLILYQKWLNPQSDIPLELPLNESPM